MYYRRMWNPVLRSMISVLFLAAAFYGIRLAYADFLFRSGSPANWDKAADVIPNNASYQLRRGDLRKALELNPYLSGAWLQLAVEAEMNGNPAESERCLLQAAQIDKTFEPRWALVNFYFRQNRTKEFWQWYSLAMRRSYGDRSALFRLARLRNPTSEEMLSLLPRQAAVLAEYLEFQLKAQDPDAFETALSLLPLATGANRDLLVKVCDQQLKQGAVQNAVRLWNAMVEQGILIHAPLNPPKDDLLSNPALEVSPLNAAFDWSLLWRAGVSSYWSQSSHQLRIALDGKQDEKTDLLTLDAPIVPARNYQFRFRFRTDGFEKKSGLVWTAESFPSLQPIGRHGTELYSQDWSESSFSIRTPANADAVRLTLSYQRSLGTVRQHGTIIFAGAFSLAQNR